MIRVKYDIKHNDDDDDNNSNNNNGEEDDDDDDGNNNNNKTTDIEVRIFEIFSLRSELSFNTSARVIRAQFCANHESHAYHVQHAVCRVV